MARKIEIYEAVEILALSSMLILYAMRLYRKNREIKEATPEIIDIETNVVE